MYVCLQLGYTRVKQIQLVCLFFSWPLSPETRGAAVHQWSVVALCDPTGDGTALPPAHFLLLQHSAVTAEWGLGEPSWTPLVPQLGLTACTLPILINLANPQVLRKRRVQAVCLLWRCCRILWGSPARALGGVLWLWRRSIVAAANALRGGCW